MTAPDHPRTWDLFAVRRWVRGGWRYYAPFVESADWLRVTNGNRGDVTAVQLTESPDGPFVGLVDSAGVLCLVEFGRRRFEQQFPDHPASAAVMAAGEVVRLAVSER